MRFLLLSAQVVLGRMSWATSGGLTWSSWVTNFAVKLRLKANNTLVEILWKSISYSDSTQKVYGCLYGLCDILVQLCLTMFNFNMES